MIELPPRGIEAPVGLGSDVPDFLAAHGIVDRVPSVRSSDVKYLENPRQYYFSRRLGLAPVYSYEEALSIGTWMHNYLELWGLPDCNGLYSAKIAKAQFEMDVIGPQVNWTDREVELAKKRIEWDAVRAEAWFNTAVDLQVKGYTVRGVIQDPRYRVMERELLVRWEHPEVRGTSLVAQFDQLLYNERDNKLYILDLKTTSWAPVMRAMNCSVEFQCRHYLYLLEHLLASGTLHERHSWLPSDVRIGGMWHIILEKPSINFGSKDRPYQLRTKTLTRGPRKGTTITEKDYEEGAEPDPDIHLQRCREWYEERAAQTEFDKPSPVEASLTEFNSVTHEDVRYSWLSLCKMLGDMATRKPWPVLFPDTSSAIVVRGQKTAYADLYLRPVRDWPMIARRERMIQHWRDPSLDTHESEPLDIFGAPDAEED